jgi:hypothetical protein
MRFLLRRNDKSIPHRENNIDENITPMYKKEEASRLKQAFWTTFGQYMAPVLSSEGERVNWINYKTGVRDVYFRMEADQKRASIAIEMTHKDRGIRELYFEQLKELKTILHKTLEEEWNWELNATDEFGKTISCVGTEITGVNVFDKETWPELIQFFKPRIIKLDEFWSTARYAFDELK